MGVENSPDVSTSGKRGAKRNRVLLAARVRTSAGDVDARLRDLSRQGALIECAYPLNVGDEVIFTRGATIVPARVAWTGGDRVGLEFLRLIDESEVLIQLGRGPSGPAQQRFRRPALHENLSAHERKLARVWGASVGINISGD